MTSEESTIDEEISSNSTAKKRLLDDSSKSDECNSNDVESKRVKTEDEIELPVKRKIPPKPETTGPILKQPEYYFEFGLRKVRPYWFRFVTWSKRRWLGRTLKDVFCDELYSKDPTFFDEQAKLGRLTINDKPTSSDHVLKDRDLVKNITHRHEMPVLDRPIEIILSDDEAVVVNKPCSIPTHPCGRYYFNSLLYLLEHQFGLQELKVIHRLDRLTSGLVIFAKTASKARELADQISNKTVQKEYLCRVEGVFPENEIVCEKPIAALCPKMGVHWVTPDGKPCRTRFQKVSSDDKDSIVRCFPETGRTHQIRVHLQYTGYPIVNDCMYNNAVFGPEKGKEGFYGKSHEQLRQDIGNEFSGASWVEDFDSSLSAYLEKRPESSIDAPTAKPDSSSPYYDHHCVDCHIKSRDPTVQQLEMYLHCLKYEGPNWSYSTPVPKWAVLEESVKE